MIPNLSLRAFTTGARQFVVQDALEIILSFSLSRVFSLTPRTIVLSRSLPGALTMTFLAPALRCFSDPSRSRNTPVDSITTSTCKSAHGRLAGSRSEKVFISLPLILIESLPLTSISARQGPYIESCLRRCTRSAVGDVSLIATISTRSAMRFARRKARPIRPSPLIATRGFMLVGS